MQTLQVEQARISPRIPVMFDPNGKEEPLLQLPELQVLKNAKKRDFSLKIKTDDIAPLEISAEDYTFRAQLPQNEANPSSVDISQSSPSVSRNFVKVVRRGCINKQEISTTLLKMKNLRENNIRNQKKINRITID